MLDPVSGKDQAAINTNAPVCSAMDLGFGSLWIPVCGPSPQVFRCDPAVYGAILAAIPINAPDLQEEGSVAAGEGAVWVMTAGPNQKLVRIDPKTNKVAGSYPMPSSAAGVRAGEGGVWVTVPADGTLLHVDPSTGKTVATITVGSGPRFLTIGAGGIWVMNAADGSVSHVDPTTDTVVATIDIGGFVNGGDIAFGGGYVWARVTDGLLVKIDPATDTVVAHYGPSSGSGSVAVSQTAVWASAHDVGTVWRLPLAP